MEEYDDFGKMALEEILRASDLPVPAGSMRLPAYVEWKEKTAQKIMETGFRPHPILNLFEQVDELPLGTVIQDDSGAVYRRAEGVYYDGPHEWQSFDGDFWDVDAFVFPVRIIAHGAYLAK
jgi:hypothetical protein